MKLHKGLSAFVVKDPLLVQELEALAKMEGLSLIRLNDELLAAPPEDGAKLGDILRRKDYYPRSISSMSREKSK